MDGCWLLDRVRISGVGKEVTITNRERVTDFWVKVETLVNREEEIDSLTALLDEVEAPLKAEVKRLREELLKERTISGTTQANLHGEIRDRDAAIKALVEAGDKLDEQCHWPPLSEAWAEAKRKAGV